VSNEELIKLYQTHKLYIFPLGVTLASLILIIFVIFPQTSKLISNQGLQTEILNKSHFLETKAQALEGYDPTDLSKKVGYATSAFPSDKDFVNAFALLQQLTSQSGFTAVATSLEESAQGGVQAQSYNVRLDVLGPVNSLPILLSNIENSPRLMRVSTVEIISGADPGQSNATINVTVLYSQDSGNLGSVDSPLPKLSAEEEAVISKLSRSGLPVVSQETTASQGIAEPIQLGPRGKSNPFE
jgi:hypothetical protein